MKEAIDSMRDEIKTMHEMADSMMKELASYLDSLQSGRRQRSPPSPGQGSCVSPWISESVFLLTVSLDSGVTVEDANQYRQEEKYVFFCYQQLPH